MNQIARWSIMSFALVSALRSASHQKAVAAKVAETVQFNSSSNSTGDGTRVAHDIKTYTCSTRCPDESQEIKSESECRQAIQEWSGEWQMAQGNMNVNNPRSPYGCSRACGPDGQCQLSVANYYTGKTGCGGGWTNTMFCKPKRVQVQTFTCSTRCPNEWQEIKSESECRKAIKQWSGDWQMAYGSGMNVNNPRSPYGCSRACGPDGQCQASVANYYTGKTGCGGGWTNTMFCRKR